MVVVLFLNYNYPECWLILKIILNNNILRHTEVRKDQIRRLKHEKTGKMVETSEGNDLPRFSVGN